MFCLKARYLVLQECTQWQTPPDSGPAPRQVAWMTKKGKDQGHATHTTAVAIEFDQFEVELQWKSLESHGTGNHWNGGEMWRVRDPVDPHILQTGGTLLSMEDRLQLQVSLRRSGVGESGVSSAPWKETEPVRGDFFKKSKWCRVETFGSICVAALRENIGNLLKLLRPNPKAIAKRSITIQSSSQDKCSCSV